MKYIDRLDPSMVGLTISCRIVGKKIKKAKIQLEEDHYYICQDIKEGDSCRIKLGFRYSWFVGNGLPEALEDFEVSEIHAYDTEWDEEENEKEKIHKEENYN